MIDEECPGDQARKLRYARIARSHLSSSEICLLGYNCSVGVGRHKFKKLANSYGLFHNYYIDKSYDFFVKEQDFNERMIGADAFNLDEDEIFTY